MDHIERVSSPEIMNHDRGCAIAAMEGATRGSQDTNVIQGGIECKARVGEKVEVRVV